jgi:hypothetical protein
MIWYLVLAVACLLAGGYGGFMWGGYVEKKAAAALGAAGGVIGQAAKKIG